MTEKEFIYELHKLNINLNNNQLNALNTYKNMLQEANKHFNLTTIIQDEDIYLKHFYDSLTLIKAIDLTQELKVLDIGTGAGFPGLVLKIIFPNLEVTLLDSNSKKISFLETVIAKLNLKNIVCLNNRAENLKDNYIEYFDLITCRAVAHLRILSELTAPYLKINGYFIPLKANINQEIIESKNTLAILNLKIITIIKFLLPITNDNRTLIKIKKISKTPNIYPRPYDKIKKYPLK